MAKRSWLREYWRPMVRGVPYTDASSHENQFAGRTTLSSGSATVTVSTAQVQSDSMIWLGVQAATNTSSNTPIEVKSINPGNHFILGTADGNSLARDATVMWMLWRQP